MSSSAKSLSAIASARGRWRNDRLRQFRRVVCSLRTSSDQLGPELMELRSVLQTDLGLGTKSNPS